MLAQHAGKVLTHRFLIGELWSCVADTQYLRVYVRQLRQKIEMDPQRPQYLVTETGVGYRLRGPDLSSTRSDFWDQKRTPLAFSQNAKEGCVDLEHPKL